MVGSEKVHSSCQPKADLLPLLLSASLALYENPIVILSNFVPSYRLHKLRRSSMQAVQLPDHINVVDDGERILVFDSRWCTLSAYTGDTADFVRLLARQNDQAIADAINGCSEELEESIAELARQEHLEVHADALLTRRSIMGAIAAAAAAGPLAAMAAARQSPTPTQVTCHSMRPPNCGSGTCAPGFSCRQVALTVCGC